MADSDSENEGVLTNIQHLVIRPPGHTGKAKKGHICFDGSHETMNLGRVDFITNQEYDVFIRPDTANPRNRFWFHFTVENTQQNQRVLFNVVNLSKSRSLFSQGLTPVVKSTSRPRWQRMPTDGNVFYYKSPLHRDHFVLSFAFCFDLEDERYHFALTQPYSLARHQAYMAEVADRGLGDFLRVEVLARTVQGRPLELLTITHRSNLVKEKEVDKEEEEDEGERIPVVFLLARSHAADTPTSFVVQGFVDFLLSSHDVAQDLRSKVVFKVVPVLNPDGVYLGNTRGNLLGQDLNRHWDDPCPFAHPTVRAVRDAILEVDADKNLDLNVVLDLHSHTSLLGLFVCGNSYDDVYRFERHIVFPKILSQNCPDFSHANTVYNTDSAKAGTARRYFCEALKNPEVNAYTVEVSALGYEVEPDTVVPYNEESYCRVGRNIARAFWDFYKILGYIPLDADLADGGEANRPKSATAAGSFNLLRLREIASQRDRTAKTFEGSSSNAGGRLDSDDDNGDSAAKRGSNINYSKHRKKSCASSSGSSCGVVTATVRLNRDDSTDFADDDDTGDDDDGVDSEGELLAPKVSPAPRVKFKEDQLPGRSSGYLELSVVPSASVAKQESPFASPCKKGKQLMLDLDEAATQALKFPSRLSQGPHNNLQLVLLEQQQQEVVVSGLGSAAPSRVVFLARQQQEVRKIGGGALVSLSSSSSSLAPRPQGLRPSLPLTADGKPRLAIVDFSALAEEGSPKKDKVRKKKKTTMASTRPRPT